MPIKALRTASAGVVNQSRNIYLVVGGYLDRICLSVFARSFVDLVLLRFHSS